MPPSFPNDIAAIRLPSLADLTPSDVGTICLPPRGDDRDYISNECWVSGWGLDGGRCGINVFSICSLMVIYINTHLTMIMLLERLKGVIYEPNLTPLIIIVSLLLVYYSHFTESITIFQLILCKTELHVLHMILVS